MGVRTSTAEVTLVLDEHPQTLEQFDTGPRADHEGLGPGSMTLALVPLISEAGADADADIGIESAVGHQVDVRHHERGDLNEEAADLFIPILGRLHRLGASAVEVGSGTVTVCATAFTTSP